MWEIRQRLLLEQLERLTERLSADKQPESAVTIEYTLQLLTIVVMLIRQHRINAQGQCDFCGWTRWSWRLRRPRCTVFRAANFVMNQSVDVVRWQLSSSAGGNVSDGSTKLLHSPTRNVSQFD